MDRVILHCDLNNFFASVECIDNPELKKIPIAVCGDPERRHGIILAKNYPAKRYGIQTGEAIFSALKKCPNLRLVPAHYGKYEYYSQALRDMYRRYTDQIESFGIDECWLDVTASTHLFGEGDIIADELRESAKRELGLTISSGVSFNKTFAKMGSDYKKPDATTVISRDNFKSLLWPLPVEDMMYVGRSTATHLRMLGVETIGDLARFDRKIIGHSLGKCGLELHDHCNGIDLSTVADDSFRRTPRSVGNSTTTPRDLLTDDEVFSVLYMLSDKVAARLRAQSLRCMTVSVSLRNSSLEITGKRTTLRGAVNLTTPIFTAAKSLYLSLRPEELRLRSVGVCCENLSPDCTRQLSLLGDSYTEAKTEKAYETVDKLRKRYGRSIIGGAMRLTNPDLTYTDPIMQKIRPGGYDADIPRELL